mgnify:CR=1 FL=1
MEPNILLERAPSAVPVGNACVPLNTSHRTGIQAMRLADDPFVGDEEKARALKRRNVMELAVQRVLCATADQTIGEIADVLAKKKFKKVPVIDEDGRLIGMVRRATITRYLFDVLCGEEEPSAE